MSLEEKRANPLGPRVSASDERMPDESGTLPIRLSVTRGGLGIELSGGATWGRARIRELSLSLLGVTFPVDLSRGVKQFLTHRTQLEVASLELDLPDLGSRWGQQLHQLWGEPVSVRLCPVPVSGAHSPSATPAQSAAANSEGARFEGVEVTLSSESGCLVFELLLVGGPEPVLVVDAARSLGDHPYLVRQSALAAAIGCFEAGITGLSGQGLDVDRAGRVLSSSQLAVALCLAVLPGMGLRIPRIDEHVIADMEHSRGTLSLRLGRELEPAAASSRVIGLLSIARSLTRADDAALEEREGEARSGYLAALEAVPRHALASLELAELDLLSGDRAEAALSFLDETEAEVDLACPQHRSRAALLTSRALSETGRDQAAREALARALESERNPLFFARLSLELAERVSQTEALAVLERAVSRAPSDASVRRARFVRMLEARRLDEAARDADHLLALAPDAATKGQVCLDVARRYDAVQVESAVVDWLRRSLRYCPDHPETQLRLASALRLTGQVERALHLVNSAIHSWETTGVHAEEGAAASEARTPERSALLAKARLLLAELLLETGQPTAALLQSAQVDTRGELGVRARHLEAREHQRHGRFDHRDRALVRLVEAFELGWVKPRDFPDDLARFCKEAVPPVGERVLGALLPHDPSDDTQRGRS